MPNMQTQSPNAIVAPIISKYASHDNTALLKTSCKRILLLLHVFLLLELLLRRSTLILRLSSTAPCGLLLSILGLLSVLWLLLVHWLRLSRIPTLTASVSSMILLWSLTRRWQIVVDFPTSQVNIYAPRIRLSVIRQPKLLAYLLNSWLDLLDMAW